jgi:hypothetical protein
MFCFETFAEWRLPHLDDEWQEPPKGWVSPAELRRMPDKRARWLWVNLQRNAIIDERAQALDLRAEYSNDDEWKKLGAEIEAQYPDDAVCKMLLIQHHDVIAGVEVAKKLPVPPLLIDVTVAQRELVPTSPA